MHSAILQAINGVSLAALLFLLASGFTLTFGLMRVVNMAHGAYYLLGGYIGLSIARSTGSFALARRSAAGSRSSPLGFLIDRFLIRRTGENHLAQVLLTVGIAFVIGDVALKIWGGDNLKVPMPIALRGAIELPGGIIYPTYRFVLIAVRHRRRRSSLWLLYRKTQIGAVVRAGVDDREIVSAIGINIDRLFVLVSALASFLAGMAGVVGGAFLTLYPGAEWEILVYALVVVIFGGLGSLEGAMIGALIVGLLDAYGRWLLPEFSYFVLFGPMAILLLFRPQGIFGREGMSDAQPRRTASPRCSPRRLLPPLAGRPVLDDAAHPDLIFGLLALSVDLLLGHAGLYSLCHASFFAVAAYTIGHPAGALRRARPLSPRRPASWPARCSRSSSASRCARAASISS